MGACTGNTKRKPEFKFQRTDLVWREIRDYSFDTPHFKFMLEIQNHYTDVKGGFLAPDKTAMLVLQFKRFLYLVAVCMNREREGDKDKGPKAQDIAPSPMVDRLWRLLISNFKAYDDFCTKIFQKFYHRKTDKIAVFDNYKATVELYSHYFGVPDVMTWPPYSSQKALQYAHKSHIRMSQWDFFKFQQRFEKKLGGKEPDDIQRLYANIMEGQRKKVSESNKKGRKPEKQKKVDQEGLDPFAGFASMEVYSFSNTDFNLTNSSIGSLGGLSMANSDRDSFRSNRFKGGRSSAVEGSNRKKYFNSSMNDSMRSSAGGPTYRNESIDYQMDNMVDDWHLIKAKFQARLKREEISSTVRRTFTKEQCMSNDFAKIVFEEYKRFMLMQLLCRDNHFVEPDWVRQMRNCHIIETKKYADFCFKVFQQMVLPPPKRKIYQEYWKRDYQTTLDCYRIIYNCRPNKRIWQSVREEFKLLVKHEFKFYDLRSYTFNQLNHVELPIMRRKDVAVLNLINEAELIESSKAIGGMKSVNTPGHESADELLNRIEDNK